VNSTFAIETSDLRKHYGAVEALRGVNLTVPVGSICGFLGRNGAGKTTTIKVLLGMARPTSGTAQVFGVPAGGTAAAVDVRRRIGFVSDDKDLFDYMTVAETIRFTAAFFPRWRADLETRYLRSFELPPDRKVKALSRGMRTKLSLLLALCRGADLLILDEPTSGLDPANTQRFAYDGQARLVSCERERWSATSLRNNRRSRVMLRPTTGGQQAIADCEGGRT
jgi:ABC-2 type transport system ATP-binding protein